MYISTGADGITWGINSSDQVVRHLGNDHWEVMPATANALTQISVGNANNIWGFDGQGNIYNWDGDAYQWDQVAGFAVNPVSLSVGNDGTAWAVGTDNIPYRYDGDNTWHQSPPAFSPRLAVIAVRNSGEVWGIPASGYDQSTLYRYDGSTWYATPLTLGQPLASLSVASDGTFYVLTQQGGLYRWVAGTAWQPYQLFPGTAGVISAGSQSNVWGMAADGELYRMTPDPDAWQQMPGSMSMIAAAADGTVYGVNTQSQIYLYQGDCAWSPVAGSLAQVVVGSRNEVWGLDSSQTPLRLVNGEWVNVKGSYPIESLGVGADMTVWGISPVVNQALLACEANTYWEPLFAEPNNPSGHQALKQVAVGSYENIWCLDQQNQLHRWDGATWTPATGNYVYVTAAADGSAYALDSAGNIYRFQDSHEWRQVGGNLKQISAGSADEVWGVDANNNILKKGGIQWAQVSWLGAPAPGVQAASASAAAGTKMAREVAPAPPALTAANVQAALTSTLNMYDWVSEYHDEFQDVITIAYDLMNVPTTHDPGQAFAEVVLELSIQAIAFVPVPGASTISKIVGGVYNYVNTDQATDLHGTFASILDRFSQNTIALKTELSQIADNLRTIQDDLNSQSGVTPQDRSNWVEPFTDPATNQTIVVADLATAGMPARATTNYRTLLTQAESAGRLSLWQQTLPTKYKVGRPTDWGGGPEWTNESDCQGFMACFVDSHPSYYLKPYQRDDGKDTVWALKYYWLNAGGYADQNFAPQDLCDALFQDDGAGNVVRPNALATRADVFKHWGLHEDKVQLTMNPISTDWYPGKSWHCSTDSKVKMIAAARPALTQEQVASNQFAGVSLAGEDIGAADLPNANLRGSNLEGTNLRAADLRNADLADANLSRANLSQAHLNAARADGAVLNGVDLTDAVGFNLRARGAQLKQARLAGASLRGADLSGADLSGADLSNADLTGANLSNADLSNAALKRATLRSANLTGANVQGVDLTAADTTFAVGVDGAPQAAAKTSRALLRFYTQPTLDQLALTAAAHAITGNVGSVPMNGFGNLVDVLREGAGNFAQFIVPTTPPQAGDSSRDLTLTVGTGGQGFYQSAASLFSAFGIGQSYVNLLSGLGQTLGYTPLGFRTQITNDDSTDVHIYFGGPIGLTELTIIGGRVRQVDASFTADAAIQQAAAALGASSVGVLGLDFSPISQRVTEAVFPIQPDDPNAAATLANAMGITWANLDTVTGWLADVTLPYLVSLSVQESGSRYAMSVYFPYSAIAASNILTLVDEADQQRFRDLLEIAAEGSLYVPFMRVMCDFDGSTAVSTLITALRNPGLSGGDSN